MTESSPPIASTEITALLVQWSRGDHAALERLLPMIYDECRRIASRQLRHEHRDHTLDPTALVHEAYLRLVDQRHATWENRAQFFGVVAQVMRRILVDYARSRDYQKRGGGVANVPLDEALVVSNDTGADLVALDDALEALAAVDARKSQVVEMRFFGGLTVAETAEALHVSEETVARDWRLAKVWLLREISGDA